MKVTYLLKVLDVGIHFQNFTMCIVLIKLTTCMGTFPKTIVVERSKS